jgi:pilus assembly protein CpaF
MQTRSASLEGTGEITLRDLVREALRMRPTRLVVGEVRLGEALDLLIAMNSGVPAMATIHANSAQQAITKMCTLPLLAGPNIGAAFVVPTVAGCVDVVVHLALEDGTRRVRSIHAVTGEIDERGVVLAEVFRRDGAHLVRSTEAWPTSGRWSAVGCQEAVR